MPPAWGSEPPLRPREKTRTVDGLRFGSPSEKRITGSVGISAVSVSTGLPRASRRPRRSMAIAAIAVDDPGRNRRTAGTSIHERVLTRLRDEACALPERIGQMEAPLPRQRRTVSDARGAQEPLLALLLHLERSPIPRTKSPGIKRIPTTPGSPSTSRPNRANASARLSASFPRHNRFGKTRRIMGVFPGDSAALSVICYALPPVAAAGYLITAPSRDTPNRQPSGYEWRHTGGDRLTRPSAEPVHSLDDGSQSAAPHHSSERTSPSPPGPGRACSPGRSGCEYPRRGPAGGAILPPDRPAVRGERTREARGDGSFGHRSGGRGKRERARWRLAITIREGPASGGR